MKKTIFFGDSITEAGVTPGGYIRVLEKLLEEKQPDQSHTLSGAGIGGNKIYDLYLRHEKDVLSKQPDQVVIFVGVNDVWHKSLSQTGTDEKTFRQFYLALIEKMQAAGIQVLLCTPACIGEKGNLNNYLDKDLNDYSDIIRELAATKHCRLCDLRALFLRYFDTHNPLQQESGLLTTDGVHLNERGNNLVATALLPLLG